MALFAVIWVLSPFVLIPMLIIYIRASKNQEKICFEKDREISRYMEQIKKLKAELEHGSDMPANDTSEDIISQPVSLEEVEPVVKSETVRAEAVHTEEIQMEAVPTEAVHKEAVPAEPVETEKPGYTRTSGVYMFGIGVVLVLIAGTIFATTTWNSLGPLAKIAVLLGAVAVFFASAWFAEKKLHLRETSITFFILGSGALAFINLAAGYFGWYGGYYKDFDNGAGLIWGITTAIIALCLLAGRWIYDMVVMSGISYCFALLTVEVLTLNVTTDIRVQLITCGIFLLVSILGAELYERQLGCEVCIKKIASIASMVLIVIATLDAVFDYRGIDEIEISEAVSFYIMGIVVLVLGFMISRNRYETDKGIGAIVRGTSLVCLCMSDRLLPSRSYDLVLTWIVLIAVYAYDSLKKRKTLISVIFMQTAAIVAFVAALSNMQSHALFAVVPVAIVQYALQRRADHNYTGIIPASVMYMGFCYLIADIFEMKMYDLDDAKLIGFIVMFVIAVLTVTVARFVQKPIILKTEEKTLIEWCSPAAFFPALFGVISAADRSRECLFIALILLAFYFASYYRRVSDVGQKVLFTIAAVIFTLDIGFEPFFEIADEFLSEWVILMFVMGAGLITLIYRQYKEGLRLLWTVISAICFAIEFVSIRVYAFDDELVFTFYKIAVYLAGVIVLFVIAYMRSCRMMLIETGFVLAAFSFLADNVDATGIFILAALVGVAYMVYQHFARLSKWSFLPVVQIYVLMFIYDPPRWAWACAFVISTILGFVLHRYLDGDDGNKTWVDDWINISGIIPVFHMINCNDDRVRWFGILMLAVFVLSFYRRYDDDRDSVRNRAILTAMSLVVLFAWMTQPWIDISSDWKTEWYIVGIMITTVFNMIVVYRSATDEKPGWITFIIACICSAVQLISAISSYEAGDAVFLGIAMILLLVWSYLARKKQWFILGVVTLGLLIISSTRVLWLSIAWWVYLLIAGSILIAIATVNEYNKRHGKVKEKKVFFGDWSY